MPGERACEGKQVSSDVRSAEKTVKRMPRFLIDVPHPSDQLACARVVTVFLTSGSHFLRNADWGCMDGEHHAWMIVEVDSKDEARSIVPPAFRAQASIVGLNTFSMDQIEAIMRRHTANQAGSRSDAGA